MKVLQINSVCGVGSTGRIATDLYDVLQKDGHDCCIAFGRGIAPKRYKTIKIGNRIDFYSHVLQTRLFDRHGLASGFATKKLINKIKEYNPDIIHIHNIHGYYLNFVMLFDYLSTLDIPIIWLLHDQWSMSPHSAYFDLQESELMPDKNQYDDQKYEYPKSFIDNSRRMYKLKEKYFTSIKNLTIITPSHWLKKYVEKSFLGKYDIQVINNGIDLTVFKPMKGLFRKKYNLLNKRIILGVANIWDSRKGLDAFNYLADKLDDSYKVVIIGKIASSTKISSKILTVQQTTNVKELVEIYSDADLFINPTTRDNFPTTNIEALACGIPVITFNTGGSAEALTKDIGRVVERSNFEELLYTIERFEYEKDYSTLCIERAKNYDKNKVYDKYIKLYKKVITTINK